MTTSPCVCPPPSLFSSLPYPACAPKSTKRSLLLLESLGRVLDRKQDGGQARLRLKASVTSKFRCRRNVPSPGSETWLFFFEKLFSLFNSKEFHRVQVSTAAKAERTLFLYSRFSVVLEAYPSLYWASCERFLLAFSFCVWFIIII